MNKELEKILERADELMKQETKTARFGDKWKEQAENIYTIQELINTAQYQGRKNIFLMIALKEYFKETEV